MNFMPVSDVLKLDESVMVNNHVRVKILEHRNMAECGVSGLAIAADDSGSIVLDIRSDATGGAKVQKDAVFIIFRGYWSTFRKMLTLGSGAIISKTVIPLDVPSTIAVAAPTLEDVYRQHGGDSVPIGEVVSSNQPRVTISGRVVKLGSVRDFHSTRGRNGSVRNLYVKDASGMIRVALFRAKAFFEITLGSYISISGLTLTTYRSEDSLSSTELTQVENITWSAENISSEENASDLDGNQMAHVTYNIVGIAGVLRGRLAKSRIAV